MLLNSNKLSAVEFALFKTSLLADGLKDITAPALQFCVLQNKNSLKLKRQFATSSTRPSKFSNSNPMLFKYASYPKIKSATSCAVLYTVPYGTVVTVFKKFFLICTETPPSIGSVAIFVKLLISNACPDVCEFVVV